MNKLAQKIAEIRFKLKSQKTIILGVGFLTFFFGFAAPAGLNLYLLSIHSPLVLQFRSSLMFISSILGDGIILPIVNMVAISFLVRHKELGRLRVIWALIFGVIITAYFHIVQASQGLVNWSMPRPWEWNFLGFWHALYMLSVTSLISLFYIVLTLNVAKHKKLTKESILVTLGIILFLILLKLDYIDVKLM